MSSSHRSSVQLVIPESAQTLQELLTRLYETTGEVLLLLWHHESSLVADPALLAQFLTWAYEHRGRLFLASKNRTLLTECRRKGIRVVHRSSELKVLLRGNPKLNEAIRAFSPNLWRQHIARKLQRMGFLSMPTVRIFSLVAISIVCFLFVLFSLLPSTDIIITPRRSAVSHTANILLVRSGAVLGSGTHIRTLPLIPVSVTAQQSMVFDHVSKQFIGRPSILTFRITNTSDHLAQFRQGTRVSNQAGMVFRIDRPVAVPASGSVLVTGKADPSDLYGQIIGERGNVPPHLQWQMPGLAPADQELFSIVNSTSGTGGTTLYRSILTRDDIDLASRILKQDLTDRAQQLVLLERDRLAARTGRRSIELFSDQRRYEDLIPTVFSGVLLPVDRVGQEVTAVPISGTIRYTVFGYDPEEIFQLLHGELASHVRQGRRLLPGKTTLGKPIVIEYAPDVSWVKITVDLTGAEEYVLDPLSVRGALFGKRVRDQILLKTVDESRRIITNMPEVEHVTIKQFPPWRSIMPGIPSHISIVIR